MTPERSEELMALAMAATYPEHGGRWRVRGEDHLVFDQRQHALIHFLRGIMTKPADNADFNASLRAAGVGPQTGFPMPGQSIASTSDARVEAANPATTTTGRVAAGAFRSQYRHLTDSEKDLVDRIKTQGEVMYRLLAEAGGTDPATDRLGSANLTLAFRGLEDCVMRAVKHITK